MIARKMGLALSVPALVLLVSIIAGAGMVPEADSVPPTGSTAARGGVLTPADTVTVTTYLPLTAKSFDPDAVLPPGHVFVAANPRITRRTESLGGGKTCISFFISNNLARPIEGFSLTVAAEAAVGAVEPVTITTDQPDLFALSQTGGPDVVSCTFSLDSGQVLAANQSAELACTYREISGTVVLQSETIEPDPFIADEDYDQVHDLIAQQIEEASQEGEPDRMLSFIFTLVGPPTQSDLDEFTGLGGEVRYPFSDGFSGNLPADAFDAYIRYLGDCLVFADPNMPVEAHLNVVTRNTRAANVWKGQLNGRNVAEPEYAFEGDDATSIAIIDTGLDRTHPALAGAKIRGWIDLQRPASANAEDVHGHGSHVAGISAGPVATFDHDGDPATAPVTVTGVAPNARLVGIRVPGGAALADNIIQALSELTAGNFHENNEVVVANISWGLSVPIRMARTAVERVLNAGVPVVVSAGNDFDAGAEVAAYAAAPAAITVGAVNDDDEVTWYSTNGDARFSGASLKPDVVAPGGDTIIDADFHWTGNVLSIDANAPEWFDDRDGDGVRDPGDRRVDGNGNGRFDWHLDYFLDRPPYNAALDGGEFYWNNNGVAGFQPGGDRVEDRHPAGALDNAISGETYFDQNNNGVHDSHGSTIPMDDYVEMNGTSMAAPVVAGEMALIADAITDYDAEDPDDEGGADEDAWNGRDDDGDNIIDEDLAAWDYSREAARMAKSVVLMTTFEVPGGQTVAAEWLWWDESNNGRRDGRGEDELIFDVNGNRQYDAGVDRGVWFGSPGVLNVPNGTVFNDRLQAYPYFQNAGASNDPRTRVGAPAGGWDRGGKDHKEGYGRVAIDAAIEAVTKPFCGMAKDQFGSNPEDKKVWARHLHLYEGKKYKALLEGPGGADYDLYLYNGIPDSNGEPVLVKKSTGGGADEAFTFNVPADGLYYLVVRRVTGAGEFTVRLVTPEEWTLMAYMPGELEGDDDLDQLLFEALNDMEEVGSGEEDMKHFQLLALVDYDERAYDGKDGPPPDNEPDHRGDAVLYCVRKDHQDDKTQYSVVKQPADLLTLTNPGQRDQKADVNMGDPETVKKFAEWAVDYFPAKHYALIMWGDGRGYGWKANPDKALGAGNDTKRAPDDDDDANMDALTMQELRDALMEVKGKINAGSQYRDGTGVEGTIDLVGFDMGHMGLLEVGHQIQESTEIMVASEERIHDKGWPYKEILDALTDNAEAWDGADFGKEIVSLYHTYYTITETDNIHTLSAVRLNPLSEDDEDKFKELVDETSAFAAEMLSVLSEPDRGTCEDEHDKVNDNVQVHLKHSAREAVLEFEDKNYIDLQDFASLVKGSPICPGDITRDEKVIELTQKSGPVIQAEEHGSGRANAHGLSIYFPRDQLLPEDKCEEAPEKGERTCGFDSPFPSKEVYAKDAFILIPALRQPPASDTHPRPEEDLRFTGAAQWDEFLHRYYKPVADACVRVGGDCIKVAAGLVNTQWTLSGAGSSDSDGPNQDDVPVDWYWDADPTKDIPPPAPTYPVTSATPVDPGCTEDCDRDAADETDDDPDLVGKVVTWVCPTPGMFPFRLMTHDEHNDQNRQHDEETHFVHWKLHDDDLLIICFPFIITKTVDTVTPVPGDLVGYDVAVTNNYPQDLALAQDREAAVREFEAVDRLPDGMALQPSSLTCEGTCSFDNAAQEIVWTGSLAHSESAGMSYDVIIDETIPVTETTPITLENTITVTLNGYVETESTVITVTEEPCVPLTTVTLTGPGTVAAGDIFSVTAACGPADASPLFTYEWTSYGLVAGQGTATASYQFETLGANTLGLTATNCDGEGSASVSYEVWVAAHPTVTCTAGKTDSMDPVPPGGDFVYTINIENTGEHPGTALKVVEDLPDGLEVIWAEPEPTMDPLTWELGDLPSGESRAIQIGVRAAFSLPEGTMLVNQVTVSALEFEPIVATEETLVSGLVPGRVARRLPIGTRR